MIEYDFMDEDDAVFFDIFCLSSLIPRLNEPGVNMSKKGLKMCKTRVWGGFRG
jgi:hypothetical protein